MESSWPHIDNTLQKTYEFEDFKIAFGFMSAVALESESQHHHPNWSNIYNTVVITLTTHDAGNVVTQKDHKLAIAIDRIAKQFTEVSLT